MSEFTDKIDEKLKKQNMKRVALCDYLKTSPNAVAEWKRRGTIPAGDVCVRIADFLGVDLRWLITGEGSECPQNAQNVSETPPLLTEKEETLLHSFRDIPEDEQEEILMLLEHKMKKWAEKDAQESMLG